MDRKYFTEPQTIAMHITDGGVVLLQFKLLAEERRQLTHRDTGQPHELLEASWGSLYSIFTAVSPSPIMELACLRKEPRPSLPLWSKSSPSSDWSSFCRKGFEGWITNYSFSLHRGSEASLVMTLSNPTPNMIDLMTTFLQKGTGTQEAQMWRNTTILLNAAQRTTAERGLEVVVGQQL